MENWGVDNFIRLGVPANFHGLEVLSLLALLVQKYKYLHLRSCSRLPTGRSARTYTLIAAASTSSIHHEQAQP